MNKDNNDIIHEQEDEDQIILTLEDDSELVCDIIAFFPVGDRDYIVLQPAEDPESDFFIYRYEDRGNDEFELVDIEDDDELDAAEDAFEEMLDSEEFDAMFDDDEDSL